MYKTAAIVLLGLLALGEGTALAVRPAQAAPPAAAPDPQLAQLEGDVTVELARNQRLAAEVADLTAQRDAAIRSAQEGNETAIGLQRRLDAAAAIASVRIAGVDRADRAACSARLTNVEAQLKLLPGSGPLNLAIRMIEFYAQQPSQGPQ